MKEIAHSHHLLCSQNAMVPANVSINVSFKITSSGGFLKRTSGKARKGRDLLVLFPFLLITFPLIIALWPCTYMSYL